MRKTTPKKKTVSKNAKPFTRKQQSHRETERERGKYSINKTENSNRQENNHAQITRIKNKQQLLKKGIMDIS